mmetsp:Transcript_19713/g.27668  ORF Transcript_19713/g.27668 Transcript_19713/m.27668 type:complete len:335 (-) Transcript_19713:188-1192(-)
MYCGDRVKHTKHDEYGGAWVVGVAHDHLYFHWDVDDGATFLQSCSNAEQLHKRGVVLEFSPTRQLLQVIEQQSAFSAPDFGKLLQGPDRPFSDVSFDVSDERGNRAIIRAHRNILVSRSKYFESLLMNGMSESKQEDITLRDTPPAAFAALLQFLYTGETELLQPHNVDGLDDDCVLGNETKESVEDVESDYFCAIFGLADKYQVEDLKQYCLNRLDSCLSVKNVFKFMLCAHALSAPNIKGVCVDYVVDHYEEAIQSAGFRDLCTSPQLMQDIILECHYRRTEKRRKVQLPPFSPRLPDLGSQLSLGSLYPGIMDDTQPRALPRLSRSNAQSF